MPCLCHSGKEYEVCCGPYHGGEPAPTPLALMRSRYSAYALGKAKYIMETTAPLKREEGRGWRKRIELFSDETTFEGLEILEDLPGEMDGIVEFRAILKRGGEDISFTERSYFVKEGGRWYYEGVVGG